MATSILSSSSSLSSLLQAKLSKPSLTQSPISFSTNFFSKPVNFFKLNCTHFTNPILSFSFHRYIPKASAFDSFEEYPDDKIASRSDLQSDPEANEQEIEDDKEELKQPFESNDEGRLYVGNLPYSMTSMELSEVFQEAGRVANVEIIYDRVTDRSRGFGFVTMASVEEANEAIKMFNGSQIGGRTVRVNFPEVPKGGEKEVIGTRIRTYKGFIDSPYKIYAGNLGWRLTSQGLRDAFANQPGTLSAKVIYERDTGRSRGFGFVSFESAEDAEAALNSMNGMEVEGRPLRLNLAAERANSPRSVEANDESNLQTSELISSIGS